MAMSGRLAIASRFIRFASAGACAQRIFRPSVEGKACIPMDSPSQ